MKPKIKIILIQPQGIGDMVLMTALLRLIKRSYINSTVRMIVSTESAKAVIDGSLLIDEIIVFNRNKKGFFSHIKLIWDNFIFSPDIFYVSPPANKILGELLSFLSGARIRIGISKTIPIFGFTHSNPNFALMHQVDLHINLFNLGLSLKSEPPKVSFNLTTEEIAIGNAFFLDNKLQNKFVLGVHVGSDSSTLFKRYPLDRFQLIVKQYLNESQNNIAILFFGPDEDHIADKIEAHPRTIILRKKPIKFIASIIANLNLMLTSDSGLGQISAALDIPTNSIFGPGDYKYFSPYGINNSLIMTEKNLSCRPCLYTQGYKNCEHFDCLNSISTKQVLSSIFKRVELLND